MQSSSFENSTLTLCVTPSPIWIRGIFGFISFLFFTLPLTAIIRNAIEGNGPTFKSVFALVLFSVLGFYMLRIFLWNHQGREIIEWQPEQITYTAHYGWFIGEKKVIKNQDVTYHFLPTDEGGIDTALLQLTNGIDTLETVIKLPKDTWQVLLNKMEKAGVVESNLIATTAE